jgi:CDP-6-deoxy-D-xylo-4-hexulose-3-dehydrase
MQAAIGCAQLEKLPAFIEARQKNWRILRDGLNDLQDKLMLPEPAENADPSWFGFLITVKKGAGITRKETVDHLEKNGIQTRMLFAGNLIKHPAFDEMRSTGTGYRVVGELKNTDMIMDRTFWVGVYPGMDVTRLKYMVTVIRGALERAGS